MLSRGAWSFPARFRFVQQTPDVTMSLISSINGCYAVISEPAGVKYVPIADACSTN